MNTFKKLPLFPLFVIILFALYISACSNSASSEEQEHADAEGFRLVMNEQTIVEQLPDEGVTGSIELESGNSTPLITIYFITHDGDQFQPEEEEYSLVYEFDEDGIATFEQNTEDGKWSFYIHAETVDTTNLTLKLFHGGVHDDFQSAPIPVQIEAAQ